MMSPFWAALIDGFANGHPAEGHARSAEMLREALFGGQPIVHVLLAEKNATAIGFGAWRKAYDLFWSMYGGDGLGLYVIPAERGFGVGLCIVAAICADIRSTEVSFSRHPTRPSCRPCTNGLRLEGPSVPVMFPHLHSSVLPRLLEGPHATLSAHYPRRT